MSERLESQDNGLLSLSLSSNGGEGILTLAPFRNFYVNVLSSRRHGFQECA